MQQVWLAIVAVIAPAIGYIVKRWIERRRRSEALKRRLQALALHQGLKREGLSMSDLDRIERQAGEDA